MAKEWRKVWLAALRDAREAHGLDHRPLDDRLVKMVTVGWIRVWRSV